PALCGHGESERDPRRNRGSAGKLADGTPPRHEQSGGDLFETLQDESSRRHRARSGRASDCRRCAERHRGHHRRGEEAVKATVFAPGSIGNVGPGFDVLGLAVDGIGDRVTVELSSGPEVPVRVRGTDAAMIPTDPSKNAAAIAANAMLRRSGRSRSAVVIIDKGLPVSGGMGGSAASSVAGAYAAALASGDPATKE